MPMDVSTPLVLVLVVCVLQASAQLTPYRQGAVILNDVCLAPRTTLRREPLIRT